MNRFQLFYNMETRKSFSIKANSQEEAIEILGDMDIDLEECRYFGEASSILITAEAYDRVKGAFGALMGARGREYAQEIHVFGKLSQGSYEAICKYVSQCSNKYTIIKYFGLIHYYYLQNI